MPLRSFARAAVGSLPLLYVLNAAPALAQDPGPRAEAAPAAEPVPEPVPAPVPDPAPVTAAEPAPATTAETVPAPAPAPAPADSGGAGDAGDEAADADEDAEQKGEKLTYPRFEFSARLMTGYEVDNRHPEADQTGIDEANGEEELLARFFLKQARVAVDAYAHERIKLTLSVNLWQPEIRNAYVNVKIKRWAQLRVGRFKRPFSRIELRSSGKLPFRSRGIFNDELIEDSSWGDRALGAMVWGELKRIGLVYKFGLMQPLNNSDPLDFKQGIDVIGRVEYSPVKLVSFGVNGAHKVLDDSNSPVLHANALGGDVRLRSEQLEVVAELDMAQNLEPPLAYNRPDGADLPFAMGAMGYLAYEIPLTKDWSLQPVVVAEYVDTDVDYAQDETFRTVFGLNVLWLTDTIRLMPQVELVQPLGKVSYRSQLARETYYLLVSVQVE